MKRMKEIIQGLLVLLGVLWFGYSVAAEWVGQEAASDRIQIEPYVKDVQPVMVQDHTDQEQAGRTEEQADGPIKEQPQYLGEFVVTAYCPCEKCCGVWANPESPQTASGTRATEGRTVGADWDTLPPGTVIEIDGVGRRTVEDKPATWIIEKYDGKILDLYFDSHKEALQFGKRTCAVWRVQP